MNLRQRKLPTDDGPPTPTPTPPPKKICRHLTRRPRIFLLLLGILFPTYLAISYDLHSTRFSSSAIDTIATSLKLQKPQHIVIIDAGSTGTRVSIFKFHSSFMNGDPVLENEVYEEIKIGLSTYSDTPKEVPKLLEKLLNKTKTIIPEDLRASTPVSLKATAGFRLLPKEKANILLEECRSFLKDSGFFMSSDAVSMMEGVDEGVYAWFTINFLLNRLNSHKISNTVAVLDLGGASTQVTYVPKNEDLKDLEGHVYTINALNKNLSIYTQSYLGMGAIRAREAILIQDLGSEEIREDGVISVRSECINPIIEKEWSYEGREYLVRGPVNGSYKVFKTQNFAGSDEKRPIVRVEDCRGVVKRFVDNVKERPVGLGEQEIWGVSYFFERATEAGLIDPFKGGIITLNAFYKGTVDACNYPNTDQPFTCLDMMYIYVLLKEAYALDGSTKLNLYNTYEGHAMTWALGAAFSVYQSDL